jgi:recombination protein RecR
VSDHDPCGICSDAGRDRSLLCVLEQPLDVQAIEGSGIFEGLYHVLHGSIAPLSNIGPDQLYLHDLTKRLEGVDEIILATNPTMEGEATALYIAEYIDQAREQGQKISPELKITRIGHGLPVGADIEYADGVTLKRALEGRREV